MSRVGKNPIKIPAGVTVNVTGQTVSVSGKAGQGNIVIVEGVRPVLQEGVVQLLLLDQSKRTKTLWGTQRSLLNNLVMGANEEFNVTLDINGVGFRVALEGKELIMQLGFSHEIRYPIPANITIKCPKPTQIIVSGASKEKVGQIASEIRSFKVPEPYKGKGIKYETETILRKEGKKK